MKHMELLYELLTANLLTMEGQDNGTARAARREDVYSQLGRLMFQIVLVDA